LFCFSRISRESVGDSRGLRADTAVSLQRLKVCTKTKTHKQYAGVPAGSLHKTHKQYAGVSAGSLHEMYSVMLEENCKLEYKMELWNFQPQFTVS
jgi:hypothetical protein